MRLGISVIRFLSTWPFHERTSAGPRYATKRRVFWDTEARDTWKADGDLFTESFSLFLSLVEGKIGAKLNNNSINSSPLLRSVLCTALRMFNFYCILFCPLLKNHLLSTHQSRANVQHSRFGACSGTMFGLSGNSAQVVAGTNYFVKVRPWCRNLFFSEGCQQIQHLGSARIEDGLIEDWPRSSTYFVALFFKKLISTFPHPFGRPVSHPLPANDGVSPQGLVGDTPSSPWVGRAPGEGGRWQVLPSSHGFPWDSDDAWPSRSTGRGGVEEEDMLLWCRNLVNTGLQSCFLIITQAPIDSTLLQQRLQMFLMPFISFA